MARSIGSVTITIGLVAIHAKLYTATSKREVAFHRLERATGARIRQPTMSSVTQQVLEHADVISGYEYTPGQYVTFDGAELKALEASADPKRVRILAIVPVATLDPTHLVRSVLVAPDKGAERGYHLLASLLAHRAHVAIGQHGTRTRDELVVLAPHISTDGLVMHECLYPDEVRVDTLAEVVPAAEPLTSRELEVGRKLLDSITKPTFGVAIGALADGGAERVRLAVENKVRGHEIVVPPPRDDAKPLTLLEQLEASVVPLRGPRKARAAAPPSQLRRRKAS